MTRSKCIASKAGCASLWDGPGTGKSVVKESLRHLCDKQYLVATVARTLHTYTNTVKILCEAFRIEFESSAFKCERRLIEQAFSLNHSGKMLVTIIDDAHLMEIGNLRKLRLLFEDFPKNHNLILIGQVELLTSLNLAVNQDLKSRVTYSVLTKRLHPDSLRGFIHRELDRLGLAHSTFTDGAMELICSFGRRGPPQVPQPLPGQHARSRPGGGWKNDRHRPGQPCPHPASLAEGNRHHRFLTS